MYSILSIGTAVSLGNPVRPQPDLNTQYDTFGRQTDRMNTGVGSEFHPIGFHTQQCDVVVVGCRAIPLVLDHPQHFEVYVFRFLCIAAIVLQKSHADVFSFESMFEIVRNIIVIFYIKQRLYYILCRLDGNMDE